MRFITIPLILAIIIGYALARFFPQPGNMLGLPSAAA